MDFMNGFFNIKNEYIEECVKLFNDNLKLLEMNKIPESYNDMENILCHSGLYSLREEYVQKYGFIMVSKDWVFHIANLVKGHKCLEVMGGCGLLSQALYEEGVDIICTDDLSWENGSKPEWSNHRYLVEDLDAICAIEMYGTNVDYVIMSWPYMDDTAYRCLMKLREVNPKASIIYIGEDWGGCTASNDFFENAEFYEDKRIEDANKVYANFPGIHDSIFILK